VAGRKLILVGRNDENFLGWAVRPKALENNIYIDNYSVNGVSRTILDMGDTEIAIYFRPAAIALVRDPLASSSFSAHTYAPPSLFFIM